MSNHPFNTDVRLALWIIDMTLEKHGYAAAIDKCRIEQQRVETVISLIGTSDFDKLFQWTTQYQLLQDKEVALHRALQQHQNMQMVNTRRNSAMIMSCPKCSVILINRIHCDCSK